MFDKNKLRRYVGFAYSKSVTYDLRTGEKCYLPKTNTTSYGVNTLIFSRSFLWHTFPNSIEISQSLIEFKTKLRHFVVFQCTCIKCR